MQDRPDAQDLLEELAKWLGVELLEKVPREERFGVRVAANVAAVVARELAAGPAATEAERARTAALLELAGERPGGEDPRELQAQAAAAIRAGRLDGAFDEALALARESVRAKLAVARPGYDAWSEPEA